MSTCCANGLLTGSSGAFVPGPRTQRAPTGHVRLDDVRLAVKDMINVGGAVTGGGNPDWAAAQSDARVDAPRVAALRAAGARLVGKTITDEPAFSLEGDAAGAQEHRTAPWRDGLTAYATLQGLDIRTHLGPWIRARRPRFGPAIAPRFAGALAGLAGLPQLVLPLRRTQGLPIGLSFISAPGNDERLLDLAMALSPTKETRF